MLTHREADAVTRAPGDAEPGPPVHPVRTTYRRLRMGGLTAAEAGNLTAHLAGLPAVPKGWQVEELERLLFVRELVRLGRLRS